jgi:hypothetical protein
MEISWLGVLLALSITGVILFAYFLGKTVGKDIGYQQGYSWYKYVAEQEKKQEEKDAEAEFKRIARTIYPIDQELWD